MNWFLQGWHQSKGNIADSRDERENILSSSVVEIVERIVFFSASVDRCQRNNWRSSKIEFRLVSARTSSLHFNSSSSAARSVDRDEVDWINKEFLLLCSTHRQGANQIGAESLEKESVDRGISKDFSLNKFKFKNESNRIDEEWRKD